MGHGGADGQRTDDFDGTDDGTDGQTEDDDGDDGTDTTRRTDDIYIYIYSSKVSNALLGPNDNVKSKSGTGGRLWTRTQVSSGLDASSSRFASV